MGIKHYTALGAQIDMSALSAKNSQTVALGNAKMNARGDIIGKGGIVLKTQEQVEAEWKRLQEQHDASIGISPDIKRPLPNMAGKKLTNDQDFDPEKAIDVNDLDIKPVNPRRRKIVDSDQ